MARVLGWTVGALVALLLGAPPLAPGATVERIGPGVTLERFRERAPSGTGWMRATVLRVDLASGGAHAEVLYPGVLSAVERLSAMARRAGALAGINGDFFNIRASNAPVGPVVSSGRLIKAGQRKRTRVVGVGTDGIGRVGAVRLDGSAQLPSRTWRLADLNDANPGFPPLLARDGIGVFTPQWGSYSRAGAVRGQQDVTEVTVRGERVVKTRRGAGSGPVARGSVVLLGAGAGGRALARLDLRDRVAVRYGQKSAAPSPFRFAIGAKYVLVRNGVVQRRLPSGGPAPRSAAGFTASGRRMILVATDGRRSDVPGLTIPELARLVRRLGAHDAALLDDGGSTTIVARLPGRELAVLNEPSDGRERPVANGIGIFPGA